jgi:WD40 repeat protein
MHDECVFVSLPSILTPSDRVDQVLEDDDDAAQVCISFFFLPSSFVSSLFLSLFLSLSFFPSFFSYFLLFICYRLRSHMDSVRMVAFHPSDALIVTASEDKTVKVWPLDTSKSYVMDWLIG